VVIPHSDATEIRWSSGRETTVKQAVPQVFPHHQKCRRAK